MLDGSEDEKRLRDLLKETTRLAASLARKKKHLPDGRNDKKFTTRYKEGRKEGRKIGRRKITMGKNTPIRIIIFTPLSINKAKVTTRQGERLQRL